MKPLNIYHLENRGDQRGNAFFIPQTSIDFVKPITEMHYVTMMPGSIRGNHFHNNRRELVVLNYDGDWELSWQENDNAEVNIEEFKGSGAVVIEIEAQVIHAFKNTGKGQLHLFCYSNHQGAADEPDTMRKVILD